MTAINLGDTWRNSSACSTEVEKKPYMAGAWDGPNEDGERHAYEEDAKRTCLSCKVRVNCLQNALSDEEAQGVRGGYEFDGGNVPVAVAREIRDTMDLKIYPHQSTGRPKSGSNAAQSRYL